MSFYVGLDLGQSQDYTALAVLERVGCRNGQGRRLPADYHCRHLQRWPLGTSYPDIIDDLDDMVGEKPLRGCTLVVDGTGVGRAVVDELRRKKMPVTLKPVLITSGHNASFDKGYHHVPKKELASTLVVLFQNHRLKIAPLPEREILIQELTQFKVKITTSGNETFESWRERDHDDLVLATALAAWIAEKQRATRGKPFAVKHQLGSVRQSRLF